MTWSAIYNGVGGGYCIQTKGNPGTITADVRQETCARRGFRYKQNRGPLDVSHGGTKYCVDLGCHNATSAAGV